MKIDTKIIDFLANKDKLTKAELLFVLLLYENKEICLSDLKKYTHFINNKDFRNKIMELKDVVPFEYKKENNVGIFSLIYTENTYIRIKSLKEIYQMSVKEIILYLLLCKFKYSDKMFLTREAIESIFGSIDVFKRTTKKFIDYIFTAKKKFGTIKLYEITKNDTNNKKEIKHIASNLNIDTDKVIEKISDIQNITQENLIQLDKEIKAESKISEIKSQIEEVKKQRDLELEKIKNEQSKKDNFISEIKNNYDSYKDKIESLFVNNHNSFEYAIYQLQIQKNRPLLDNPAIVNYVWNNRELITNV